MSAEPVDLRPEDSREEPQDGPEQDVDLDLDAISEPLRREAVGQSTTVRINGKVVHIRHANAWPASAMRAANVGNWDTWARAVIDDDSEFAVWVGADLENFEMEAVFSKCGELARLNMGKSQRYSGSRRNSRRR
jgi:hypothetical protein